jgi:anti-sigma B factor antagonist
LWQGGLSSSQGAAVTNRIEVTAERDRDSGTLRVSGEVDLISAPTLEQAIRELIDGGVRALTVDLSGVRFMDSTGLRVLMSCYKRLAEVGGELTLGSPTDAVRRVLDVSGLRSHFTIV